MRDSRSVGPAILFAMERHRNQMYGGLPYAYHLAQVAYAVGDFGFVCYVEQASAWLHDVVEDTETKIEEIFDRFGHEVGFNVHSVTGVGANRRERNADIARKVAAHPPAALIKAGDRIANLEQIAKDADLKRALMYLQEREAFIPVVQNRIPEAMLKRLTRDYDELGSIVANARVKYAGELALTG